MWQLWSCQERVWGQNIIPLHLLDRISQVIKKNYEKKGRRKNGNQKPEEQVEDLKPESDQLHKGYNEKNPLSPKDNTDSKPAKQ
jgi:hypothetical protein